MRQGHSTEEHELALGESEGGLLLLLSWERLPGATLKIAIYILLSCSGLLRVQSILSAVDPHLICSFMRIVVKDAVIRHVFAG